MEEFKERLMYLMLQHGTNRYQLAKKTGIGYTTFTNYLNGVTKPSKTYIQLLVNYFNVDPHWLQFGKEKHVDSPIQTTKDTATRKQAQKAKKPSSNKPNSKSKEADENTVLYLQKLELLIKENEQFIAVNKILKSENADLKKENENQWEEISRLNKELLDAKNKIIWLLENRIDTD